MINEVIKNIIKKPLGYDVFAGLIWMFIFLHFYYSIPSYGWGKSILGFATTAAIVFIVYMVAYKYRSISLGVSFISAALALDFFYGVQDGHAMRSYVFNFLGSREAVINFASFGLASIWVFSGTSFVK